VTKINTYDVNTCVNTERHAVKPFMFARASNNRVIMACELLLAATVRSFEHLPLALFRSQHYQLVARTCSTMCANFKTFFSQIWMLPLRAKFLK